jgi:hypothetical protein
MTAVATVVRAIRSGLFTVFTMIGIDVPFCVDVRGVMELSCIDIPSF